MTRSFIFWLLMFLWLIFGFWWYWPADHVVGAYHYGGLGIPLFIFILLALLGWQVFGTPVKG